MKGFILTIAILFSACGLFDSEEKDYVDCKWVSTVSSTLGPIAWVRRGESGPSGYFVMNDTYIWIHLFRDNKYMEAKKPDGSIFTQTFTGSNFSYAPL